MMVMGGMVVTEYFQREPLGVVERSCYEVIKKGGEWSLLEIADRTDWCYYAVSRAMNVLERKGIVEGKRIGRGKIWRIK